MKLFEHQKAVLNQTEPFNHVGYFLDMGLGKTFVGSEKMMQFETKINLIVCQKSKIKDWVEHFVNFYEESKKLMIYDCSQWSEKDWKKFHENPDFSNDHHSASKYVLVINYDLVFRRSYIAHMNSFTLLLDESQLIRNETAKRSKFILKMKPKNVILLSGTPSSGKYEKLWSQVHLLGWNISKKAFWNSFIETEWVEDRSTGFRMQRITGYKNEERLKRKLAEYGAVFMKSEDVFELPEQQEINIKVSSTKEYMKFMKDSYLDLSLNYLCSFHDDSDFYGKDTSPHKELVGETVLVKFLYARQLCGQYSKAKLETFADLIESTDDRLIVFYNFNEELDAMITITKRQERPYSIVNGSTKDLTAYEKEKDSITFVQYQSGAMGLNLQKANKTIYFTLPFGKGSCDLWEQSKKRTHRIGQVNRCFYYYLLCQGSIEEKNLINLRLGKEYNDRLFEKECT